MRHQKIKTAIKVGNIRKMVANKQTRNCTPFVFPHDGDGYYLHNGTRINENDFEKMFSVEMLPLVLKGDNKDGRKVWMQP